MTSPMTSPSTDNRVQVRVSPATAEWLGARATRMHTASIHAQAKTELDMWQTVLQFELRRIRLTLAEASCLADIMNGTLLQPGVGTSLGIAYAEVYDGFRLARATGGDISSYGAKWELDEQTMLDKLAALGPAADHALCDAIIRWWEGGHDPDVAGFAAVGLTVTETP